MLKETILSKVRALDVPKVTADSLAGIGEALGIVGVSKTKLRRAISSLHYKDGVIHLSRMPMGMHNFGPRPYTLELRG